MRILVSACLLGVACRYDGKGKACEAVLSLCGEHTLVPICPEQLGGLSTPRIPCEIVGDRVLNKCNEDKTQAFMQGAQQAYKPCELMRCEMAILQDKSPSCGVHSVYDGTFTNQLTAGRGVFTTYLAEKGIPVYTAKEFAEKYNKGILKTADEHPCLR